MTSAPASARATRSMCWLLACCGAAVLHASCVNPDEGSGATAQAVVVPNAAAAGAQVSKELVDQVRLARWHAWDDLARGLPDGYVLSVELLHSRPDEAFAVVTAVRDHRAVQSVVGKMPRHAETAGTDDPISPNSIAIGTPPVKEPPEPGVIALGSSLLAGAFGQDALASSSDVGRASDGVAIGDPPPNEEPRPEAVVLGTSP